VLRASRQSNIAQPFNSRKPFVYPRLIAFVALAAGTGVRFEQYATRRSLWLDEAELALNLGHRGFAGLTHPLGYEQGAPLGWLWIQRTLLVVFGDNEYTLRAVPLVCGVAAMFIVYALARRVIGEWGGCIAALLAAASPSAIRYSSEVKQYSSDLAVSAMLLLVAVWTARTFDRRSLLAWATTGSVAVWVSHPAVLVLAATAVALSARALLDRDTSKLRHVAAASALWTGSWVALYLISLRSLRSNGYLTRYWAADLGPRPFSVGSSLTWLARAGRQVFVDPGGFKLALLVAGLFVVGCALCLWRARADLATLLIGLAAAATLGGLADLYPLRGRLALYLLPAMWLSLAAVPVLWPRTTPGGRVATGALALTVGIVALAPISDALSLARHPFTSPDTRPLLQAIHFRLRPGESIWVAWPETLVVSFYARVAEVVPNFELDDVAPSGPGCTGESPRTAAAGQRVWVVFGYSLSTMPSNERSIVVSQLRAAAPEVAELHRGGAAAYLFDFASRTVPGPNPTMSVHCLVMQAFRPLPPTGLHTGPLGTGHNI
jgi:hypothetical protein